MMRNVSVFQAGRLTPACNLIVSGITLLETLLLWYQSGKQVYRTSHLRPASVVFSMMR